MMASMAFPTLSSFRRIIVVVEAALLVLCTVEHGSLLCLAGLAIPLSLPAALGSAVLRLPARDTYLRGSATQTAI